MNTSKTENQSNVYSSDQITREELERLIASAPTAIHRQALQQQLKAMQGDEKETDENIEKPIPLIEQSDKTDQASDVSTIEDHVPDDKNDALIKQNETITEKLNAQGSILQEKASDVENKDHEEKEISIEQINAVTEEIDTLTNQDDASVEHDEPNTDKLDVPEQDYNVENETYKALADKAFTERTGTIVENIDILANQDDIVVEKDNISITKDDSTTEENHPLIEQDDIKAENIEPSVADNSGMINKIEKNHESIEQNAILKQGKKPDNFYVSMRPKSRPSTAKMILLITLIVTAVGSSMFLMHENFSITELTNIIGSNDPGEMARTSDTSGNSSGNNLGDNLGDSSAAYQNSTKHQANSQNALFEMYTAKSMALDSLLKFDEFISLNGLQQGQQKSDIKRRLQSAQTQQGHGQYDQAEKTYRQVSAELERMMNATQQLSTKKSDAELARLNWESYRWNFFRNTQNLPLSEQEMMLIDLEAKTGQMMKDGVVQQALEGYEKIARQYTGLFNEIKPVADARASVTTIQREWRQFRNKHELSDTLAANVEKIYRNGVKFETEGNYQEAIDSYLAAVSQYQKALKEGSAMISESTK